MFIHTSSLVNDDSDNDAIMISGLMNSKNRVKQEKWIIKISQVVCNHVSRAHQNELQQNPEYKYMS